MSAIQDTLNELQRRLQVAHGRRLTHKGMASLAQTSPRSIAEWMRGATSPQAMAALLNLLSELPPNEAAAVLAYWRAHSPIEDRPSVADRALPVRRRTSKSQTQSKEIS